MPAGAQVDSVGSATTGFGELGYGSRFEPLLAPLHRGFLAVNRCTVPAIKAGLGPLFATPLTGSMMVLRTTGRQSRRVRDVPLGYAIGDGAVWCVAGFGRSTHWFRNIEADPRVEVILPGGAFYGIAEEITDRDAWLAGFRLVIGNIGIIGRLMVPDARSASDASIFDRWHALPVVRIRPTGIGRGPSDPGGLAWLPLLGIETLAVIGLVRWLRRR
jgi:deazaflavin-dependent oxidoreductase (nitroreductase family)